MDKKETLQTSCALKGWWDYVSGDLDAMQTMMDLHGVVKGTRLQRSDWDSMAVCDVTAGESSEASKSAVVTFETAAEDGRGPAEWRKNARWWLRAQHARQRPAYGVRDLARATGSGKERQRRIESGKGQQGAADID